MPKKAESSTFRNFLDFHYFKRKQFVGKKIVLSVFIIVKSYSIV